MNRESYLAAIHTLGLNQAESAKFLGIHDRTVRKWIAGDAPIPRATAYLLRLMVKRRVSAFEVQNLPDPPF
jgi:DNA-binding transcriptional regulator YiaG